MNKKKWTIISGGDPIVEPTKGDQVNQLNARWREKQAIRVLEMALLEEFPGKIAVSSSFGAESAVLLHLVSRIYRAVPVIFLETGKHFKETYEYRDELVRKFGLREVRVLQPAPEQVAAIDPQGDLHKSDPDACCDLRKVTPMSTGLESFDAWITGRKRFQNADREDLPIFEQAESGKIKVNPLANWTMTDLKTYAEQHDLPPHPLVAQGYPSIGCEVCTSRVASGEDSRSGRWRNQEKTECGIHITADGRIIRVQN